MHGDADEVVPVKECHATAAFLRSELNMDQCVEVHISEGVPHSIDQRGMDKVGEWLEGVFNKRIRSEGRG